MCVSTAHAQNKIIDGTLLSQYYAPYNQERISLANSQLLMIHVNIHITLTISM